MEHEVLEHKIIEHDAVDVIGISVRTTNENGQSGKDLAVIWDQFHTSGVFDTIPNKMGSDILGLYTDYEKDHTKPYTFIAGFFVTEVPDSLPAGLAHAKLPKSRYLVFKILLV